MLDRKLKIFKNFYNLTFINIIIHNLFFFLSQIINYLSIIIINGNNNGLPLHLNLLTIYSNLYKI